MGPFSFSINDECGLLIDGFASSPTIMMGHAKPYYAKYVEQLGYTKEKDLYGYLLDLEKDLPLFMTKMIEKTRNKIVVKSINKRDLKTYAELLRNIFNDSWTNNWGFLPFTEKEFYYIGKNLKLIIDDDFVNIAYYNGEPAGMIVYLPNLNEIIKDLNGHLFPIGFLKILYRLKCQRLKLARGVLLGVRRKYHRNVLATAIVSHMINRMQEISKRKGVSTLDISWVLEDNRGITELVKRGNGTLYKIFRIYGKSLL
jgi:GNAT superfamily N-acetyltransferase